MLIGIFYSQIVESSSLISVLFREAISHPYISFIHLLLNGFSVTNTNNYHFHHHLTSSCGFSWSILKRSQHHITNRCILPEICTFIVGFSCMRGLKCSPCELIS